MIEAILMSAANLSTARVLVHILVAMIVGLIISASYIISGKKCYSSNFAVTLVILPTVVSVVITLIGSDLARAVSLGGVFALVRFRSVPGDSKDIAYVFFAMVAGLAVGIECFAIAFVLAIFIGLVFVILSRLGYANSKKDNLVLHITIPESLNYQGAFDDLFEKYLDSWSKTKIKTTNMGTLFELSYNVMPKNNIDEKAFIDEIRARNGNLNISLGKAPQGEFPPL